MMRYVREETLKKQNECEHEWLVESSVLLAGKETPAHMQCKKCAIYMTVAEGSQLELWRYATGFSKTLSILALIVSVIALIVSMVK